jgi:hypothetical protein
MNAAQMEMEFDIAYEDIASGGAPGYTAFEKSILLTQAQTELIRELVESGVEKTDIRALVLGPFIKTETILGYSSTVFDPGSSDDVQGGDSITSSYAANVRTFTIANPGGTSLNSPGSTPSLNVGDKLVIELTDDSLISGTGVTVDVNLGEGTFDFGDVPGPQVGDTIEITVTTAGILSIDVTSDTAGDAGSIGIQCTRYQPIWADSSMYSGIVFEQDTSDMWAIVNERIQVSDGGAVVEVKPVEHAFLDANEENPFKKPRPGDFYWRVLQFGATTELFSTPQFLLPTVTAFENYYINYLDRPTPIFVPGTTTETIDGVTSGSNVDVDGIGTGINIQTNGLDCAYNSIIHRDIVLRAAKLGAAFVGDPESFQLLMNSYKGN